MIKIENKSPEEIAEIGEGYLAYWEKKTKPKSISEYLHMIERFLCELPPKAVMAVAKSGGAFK